MHMAHGSRVFFYWERVSSQVEIPLWRMTSLVDIMEPFHDTNLNWIWNWMYKWMKLIQGYEYLKYLSMIWYTLYDSLDPKLYEFQ